MQHVKKKVPSCTKRLCKKPKSYSRPSPAHSIPQRPQEVGVEVIKGSLPQRDPEICFGFQKIIFSIL